MFQNPLKLSNIIVKFAIEYLLERRIMIYISKNYINWLQLKNVCIDVNIDNWLLTQVQL